MHSAQKRLGVEVFIPGLLDKDVPCCPHVHWIELPRLSKMNPELINFWGPKQKEKTTGSSLILASFLIGPMLMFERYFELKPPKRFYSCSACRDRKDCNFFQWVDEKVSHASREAHEQIIEASKPLFNARKCWKRLQAVQELTEDERSYCHICNQLVLPKEKSKHMNHEVICGINDKILATPSHLVKSFETKKYFAQYLFSDKAIDFFLGTFQKLGYKNVLCIGAPRIHEAIQSKQSHYVNEMDSLLLDLDHRYGQFNDNLHFIHYNMFNHHFFDLHSAQHCLKTFFENSSLRTTILVMDPPFGGLVQILASSLQKIWNECKLNAVDKFEESNLKELPTFWVFPYFMESHIVKELSSFTMCDYKVDYDNHPLYKNAHGKSTKTSPVRIFTNIPVRKIVLPEDEGYRYCGKCNRYVFENNVHCERCQNCTSKDGRVWVHCEKCDKCVKQGRVHCESCNICDLPNHICERSVRGCHICGEMDHKRKNCPQRNKMKFSRKRQKTS